MEPQGVEVMTTAMAEEDLVEEGDRSDHSWLQQHRGQTMKASSQVAGVLLLGMVEVAHDKDHRLQDKDCPAGLQAEEVQVDRAYLVGQGA